ncbi:uvrD/REP helicase N-terminal domain protein [Ralstonia insidiosa]|uniref:UvrD/REP helicase N-terminal domain protein n=1 Tax=Ralstonia insidiosa TaxID=190721 RepID=A0AAC9BKM6_9RALS|nr:MULTISPECIES: UvrD-helicase domain-containing protein [Ralstonia]ANH75953.1 uvrD/REP helicase N-terminal domain protein [Ralstonia insidiosa]EPX94547.1 ATP-dependent DNA helicase [Ralstonia sp. AU12-08]
MSGLTPEQQDVVDAPMVPLCVIACAGSGKTKTAVHRLVRMRRNLGEARGRVALLSFSNVAVDTFRKAYDNLASSLPSSARRSMVDIDTLDGFLTTNIIRPHGHRTMKSARTAFLVTGSESFLEGFKFSTSSFPQPITALHLAFVKGDEVFFHVFNEQIELVDTSTARNLIAKLGRTGAYTHDLGRYWAYRALKEHPQLLAALARRYPHILIDEAQDIGSVHQAILELLIGAGSCVTLIGDPNQGIYEFAGADGKFLIDYHQRTGVKQHSLQRNFRSTPSIVALANGLCGRSDVAERAAPSTPNGAFFTGYKRNQHPQLVTAFQSAMSAVGAKITRSAVLCRGRGLADTLRGDETPAGQGLVKAFAAAAVLRDRRKDFLTAFQRVAVAVVALLDNAPHGLVSQITQSGSDAVNRELRKAIWAFTRDAATGLPASSLVADTQWHSLLLSRIKVLLASLESKFGLKPTDNIGRKLSKKALPNAPLSSVEDLAYSDATRLRVDTVHKAKGESLDAVLYITLKEHALALLDGVSTEVGRIGYVAATRARDLLWVAVPDSALKELRPTLLARGFKEVGIATTPDISRTNQTSD